MKLIRISILFTIAFFAVLSPRLEGNANAADPFAPPSSYYNTATGTGATLKQQLHNIIDNHTVLSYNAARTILQVTDRDPNDADNIVLVYNRASLDVSNLGTSIPGWNSGISWNREHTWPRSRGVDSSGPDNSDLHQLRPSNPAINSSRSNLNFGGAFGRSYGRVSDGGAAVWYPGDADAGMIARQQFYMAVRYDGSDANTRNLELSPGNPSSSGATLGNLNRLIEWHFQATSDDFERRRNDVIYDSYQRNRNPFVDRPEFAWSVFMDQKNDTRLHVGGSVAADGSSSVVHDFGRVIVGATAPAATSVTLSKTGLDGVYYEVRTTGQATSDVTGRYNAFAMHTVGQRTLNVGLNADTNVSGVYSGQVVIDNLDVTTQGGAGRGANDGDDTIDLSLTVLDHSNASFLAGIDSDRLTIDFGVITQGDAADVAFSIYNIGDTPLTAGLDYDSLLATGDDGRFTLDLTDFDALEVGAASNWRASLRTDAVGHFNSTIRLRFSDEDLPGSLGGQELVLSLAGAVVAIPEPAAFALLGLGGLAALTRRQGRT